VRSRDLLRNQMGSSILITLVAIGVISVLALAYVDLQISIKKAQARVDSLNTISQIQLNIANTMNDANSWGATIADSSHNSSMACLANQNCTAPVSSTNFVVWPAGVTNYSDLSAAVYNGISPTQGFRLNGQPCTTFSMSGNDSCPLHVDLKWSTTGCGPAPCSAPVSITANILYKPVTPGAIGLLNESLLTLTFHQRSSLTASDPCSGPAPTSEAAFCASPPYSNYRLICTSTGFRCGQVYY
jgi:hypothetical protein